MATQQPHSPAEDYADTFKTWRAAKRPVILMTAGDRGVGKSTFVNNILGIKKAPAKRSPKPVTTGVACYDYIRNDVSVQIYDTPGFQSGHKVKQDERETLAMISASTEGLADLLLYFVSLTERFDETKHTNIINKLNSTFSQNIWKRSLLILTHADIILDDANEDPEATPLPQLVNDYCKEFLDLLTKKGGVSIITKVQSVPPAATNPSETESVLLAVPVGKSQSNPPMWKQSLMNAIAMKCEFTAIPPILELQGMGWKKVSYFLYRAGMPSGAVAGGLVGAKVGAKVGAAVGGVAGATIGGALGVGAGALAGYAADAMSGNPVELADIVKAREELEARKKRN